MPRTDLGGGTGSFGGCLNRGELFVTPRLIEMHERIKALRSMNDPRAARQVADLEREISIRIVEEAQRERARWARENYGWQPMPCA